MSEEITTMSETLSAPPRRRVSQSRMSRPGKAPPAPVLDAGSAHEIEQEHQEPERIVRRTAGSPPPTAEEFLDEVTGKPIRRRSRTDGNIGAFDVPKKFLKAGWDYQWMTISVQGKAVDNGAMVDIADGGWRPVMPKEMPGFMPSGYDGATIDRTTQRLFKRPMYLTQEAKAEDAQRARNQKADKFRQAQMTMPGEAPKRVDRVQTSYEPLPREDESDIQEV